MLVGGPQTAAGGDAELARHALECLMRQLAVCLQPLAVSFPALTSCAVLCMLRCAAERDWRADGHLQRLGLPVP